MAEVADRVNPRRSWAVAALAAAGLAVVAVLMLGGGGSGHRLSFEVREAANIFAGQSVIAGNEPIGAVDDVEAVKRGSAARVSLRIDDESVWPLPQGTKFTLKQGGTLSAFNRDVLVTPGPRDAPPLRDGATVPAEDVVTPVELDTIVGTFDRALRRDMKSFVDRSGPAFANAERGLRDALDSSPPAVEQANFVLRDLTSDRRALATMIRSTDSVVDAVDHADPSFGRLIQGAATTFDAVADEESELETMLQRLPASLRQIQQTLPNVDSTLRSAGELTDRIGPGVERLRAIAPPLNGILDTLVDVGPDAERTLQVARRSTPQITRLLARVTALSPDLRSVARKADTQLGCVRPYTPELLGLFLTWGDFMSFDDGKDKILRAQVQNFLPAGSNSTPASPAQAKQAFPDLRYGFPRPPGYNAGQPWYLPGCGAGRDAVDPSADQEAAG